MASKIDTGTRICILGQNWRPVWTGTVITAHNYGSESEPDWYIELTEDRSGYEYWKQSLDGGAVVVLTDFSLVAPIINDYIVKEFGDFNILELEPGDHRTVADLLEGTRPEATPEQQKASVERTIEGLEDWLDKWKDELKTPHYSDDDRKYVTNQILILTGEINQLRAWLSEPRIKNGRSTQS